MPESFEDLIELRLPHGDTWSYPVSHGDREYRPFLADFRDPDSAWHVMVPREAAGHMIHNGGYSVVDRTVIIKTGAMVRMYHPDDPAGNGIGWDGVRFEPGAGSVTVNDISYVVTELPVEAVDVAKSFGFRPAPPAEEEHADHSTRRGRPPHPR